ncbi:hypothetical protein GIB67_028792 [Kingdonia uniflora]|uniref:Uncharacterized protein n=1 Tax=Kingdonia uniflora TaxID=39325 RepID=A0A7J7MMS6_9MAGN|nr:hypothetical protein GIB67_028792 [Kingdonia uniflora]
MLYCNFYYIYLLKWDFVIELLFDVHVFGKDKSGYIMGFGDMSSTELESTLPFRMKLANENVTNTNLQSQLKSLREQMVLRPMYESNLKRGSHYSNLEVLLVSYKCHTSDIETSSRIGCSPFANTYRPSMLVPPRSCKLLNWYGVIVAYGILQQDGRALRNFYNILIDEIVHVIEDGPLEDVVVGEIIVWDKSCAMFI